MKVSAFVAIVAAMLMGCGASLPPELQPPDDPGARVSYWLAHAERSCEVAQALGVTIPEDAKPVCELLAGQRPSVSVPSGDGPDSGAATPDDAGLGGSASNGVRSIGGGSGGG